jgi:hypothetical protein
VRTIILLAVVSVLCACSPDRSNAGTLIKGTAAHPLFKTWVVPFPSSARVISLSGKSWKRVKNHFAELAVGSPITYEDVLQLKKSSSVTVEFDDHSRLTISPSNYPQSESDDVYFTIQEKEQPANQAL